jgi:adenine-specific DNA-methyltransferase
MKYMGHKGRILAPITEAIGDLKGKQGRILDAFCGSGIVSWHLASMFSNVVWASDLQRFAAARAAAVLSRNSTPSAQSRANWIAAAQTSFEAVRPKLNGAMDALPEKWGRRLAEDIVFEHRSASETCDARGKVKPIVTRAYGGHYFSAAQSLLLDALRATLPTSRSVHAVGMSALIGAASKCAASPGHTAQPFQPTQGAARWVLDAWRRDPVKYLEEEWDAALEFEARAVGKAVVSSAVGMIARLDPGDIAFLDPPYSGVHYSRFYHVLETLAGGIGVSVEGVGRYPPPGQRPTSEFSQRGKAKQAFETLLGVAARGKVRLVITFPFEMQSNGVSAEIIEHMARAHFKRVVVSAASSSFSSLGGRGTDRAARKVQREAIISAW